MSQLQSFIQSVKGFKRYWDIKVEFGPYANLSLKLISTNETYTTYTTNVPY